MPCPTPADTKGSKALGESGAGEDTRVLVGLLLRNGRRFGGRDRRIHVILMGKDGDDREDRTEDARNALGDDWQYGIAGKNDTGCDERPCGLRDVHCERWKVSTFAA